MAFSPKRGVFAGREFRSYRAYRNELARRRGFSSWYAQQRSQRRVRTSSELERLHPAEREARRKALEALTYMRNEGLSLREAAGRAGTTPASVLRHTGSALKREGGRYTARRGDRLLRVMAVLGEDGVEHQVEIRSARQASIVGEHWAAVGYYLRTGDDSRLRRFRGKSVAGIPLETDPDAIDEWERLGELEVDDIYELSS